MCASIPIPDDYWRLTEAEMTPFVSIPWEQPIEVGETICVRVVLPARPSSPLLASSAIIHTPFPDAPWDSILLDLVGNSTGISVPVHLQPVEQPPHTLGLPLLQGSKGSARNGAHIYEADVRLRDVDVYSPAGFIEYRDAQWNFEGGLPIVKYEPEPLQITGCIPVSVVDTDGSSIYSISRHQDLPLCQESNPEGRWVAADDIPFNTTTSNILPPDNHNRIWLPYTCRMQRYNYRRFAQCLVDRYPVMHVYGDSNTRRYLKMITTLGQWCNHPQYRNFSQCLCEDYGERQFTRFRVDTRNVIIDMDPVNGGYSPVGTNYSTTAAPPNKSRIYLRKWDGLTHHNNNDMPWWQQLAESDGVARTYGRAQVAVFSLTNWDAAFTTRAYFALQIQRLLDLIDSNYGPETEIILRTGQYFCCRVDPSPSARQYSRMRNKMFDKYIVDQFKARFSTTRRLSIWDVASLGEHRPIEARKADPAACPSNHVRSELIDIENQVLFNHLCNY
ncbi:hypothetical protein H4217_000527 [Coemansia sp. RSA 1939]|nr:hypothetical protein H4217_000527 [Coemansia sp. RSA 1939]KAJ2617536.1 hypothetical protein EV177_000499 [Coemansia sp. RSA 1804]KAJ2693732.1 hypothetical protein GGH99_001017 [Coemansia sp. RSA 1285]